MNRVGVFLRCTGLTGIREGLAAIREKVGVDLIHVSKLPDRCYTPGGIAEVGAALKEAGVRADAVTIVHDGESYADIETVRRTVGYLPPETLDQRIEYSLRCVDLAEGIGVPIVTTHMGILPEESDDQGYIRLRDAVQKVAAYGAQHDVMLALETGQETAEALKIFLEQNSGPRVGINFDIANLVMYGTDEPLRSLRVLRDWVVSVHAKDARPADSPELLGIEVSLGKGTSRVRECLRFLMDSGYQGSFVIENYVRRSGTVDDKLDELRASKTFIEQAIGA